MTDIKEPTFDELKKELQDAAEEFISSEDLKTIEASAKNLGDHSEKPENTLSEAELELAKIEAEEKARLEAEEAERVRLAEAEKAKAERKKARRKRRKTILKVGGLIFAGLCLLAIAGLVTNMIMTRHYSSHFFKNTYVNGKEVSGQTAQEVKEEILGVADTYTLTLKERGDKIETLDATALGSSYIDDRQVEDLIEAQDASTWYIRDREPAHYNVSYESAYDRDMIVKSINSLSCVSGNATKPEDAYIELDAKGMYKIVGEVEGDEVDVDALTKAVFAAIDAQENEIDLEEKKCYKEPAVRAKDEAITKRYDAWNSMMSADIEYTFGEASEKINKEVIEKFVKDDGNDVSLATDWIGRLVNEWAKKYDTYGEDIEFTTSDGVTIMVPGGSFGNMIDRSGMEEDIVKAIESGFKGKRDPVWLHGGKGNDGELKTYIEISIPDQHLYLFVDGKKVADADVITGKPGPQTATEPGVYIVEEKIQNTILGSVLSKNGELEVDYLLRFDGANGVCDASWLEKFGGSVYRSKGSDGSVLVPVSAMKQIFEKVKEGCPVIIYANKVPVKTEEAAEENAEETADDTGENSDDAADGETDESAAASTGAEESDAEGNNAGTAGRLNAGNAESTEGNAGNAADDSEIGEEDSNG